MGICVQNKKHILIFFLDFSTDSYSTDGDLDELVGELNEGKMLYAAIIQTQTSQRLFS